MNSIFEFQKALIKNYYKELIVSIEDDLVDLDKYPNPIIYRGGDFLEKNHQLISADRRHIIDDIKPLYLESVAEVLLKLSTIPNNLEKLNYINYIMQLFNIPLRQLKIDVHVHQKDSRYYSTPIKDKHLNTTEDLAKSVKSKDDKPRLNIDSEEIVSNSEYRLLVEFIHNYKQLTLSFLPHSLFVIGRSFTNILQNKMNEILEDEAIKSSDESKINWTGKPSQLGYIFGQLAEMEFIEAPKRANGEINFTQFGKDVLKIFNAKTTQGSLSTYLNINTEKSQETHRNFKKSNFNLPHKKEVS